MACAGRVPRGCAGAGRALHPARGGVSSFLFEEIREKMGAVHGIGAYAFTPAFPGLLTVSGTCPIENSDGIDEIVLTKLAAWRKQGLSKEGLAKAKRII